MHIQAQSIVDVLDYNIVLSMLQIFGEESFSGEDTMERV